MTTGEGFHSMKKYFIIIILSGASFCCAFAQGNDTTLITALLKNIAATQVMADGKFYKGSFPSFRECAGVPHNYQPDNNIFFTAISAFSLRNMLPRFEGENKRLAMQLIANVQSTFPYYQNKKGSPFYNFWPTGQRILPHAYFINQFDKLLGSGEDADDAAMILMASGANDSICKLLKQRMLEVSNGESKKIKSTYKKYREFSAYSTYLGHGMLPDFDLGVHCNILYFMLDRKMPLVKQDSATIELISQIIKNREYIKAPVYISPYYTRTPLLMYHIARLMGKFSIPELEIYKIQLVTDIQEELNNAKNLMDRIILSTSLLRLGTKPPPIDIAGITAFEKSGTDKFIFFQARAAFWYPSTLKKIFLHWSYLCYYFYCPAYNKILWLEYLLERNKQ